MKRRSPSFIRGVKESVEKKKKKKKNHICIRLAISDWAKKKKKNP